MGKLGFATFCRMGQVLFLLFLLNGHVLADEIVLTNGLKFNSNASEFTSLCKVTFEMFPILMSRAIRQQCSFLYSQS